MNIGRRTKNWLPVLMGDNSWECVCGETDISKHDLGMVIAHEYELTEQHGRDILIRIRNRIGLDTQETDRQVSSNGG